MNEFEFSQLLLRTALALDDREPELTVMSGTVSIHGVDIQLQFDDESNDGCIRCSIDLGRIDPHLSGELSAQLLLLNKLSGSRTTGIYALDESSLNPVFIVHLFDVGTIEAEWLADALRAYAREVQQVRTRLLGNWNHGHAEISNEQIAASHSVPTLPFNLA